MDINLQTGKKMKQVFQVTALATALALAGCGGGGGGFYNDGTSTGGTSGGTGGGTTVTAPNTIAVSKSKSSLNTGGDSVDLAFRVLDANGGVIPNAALSFTIANQAESGASLNSTSSITTDGNGLAKVTLTLDDNALDYRINHDIVVTATSNQGGKSVSQVITIPATGTKLTLAANVTTVQAGSSANVTATAIDGTGVGISNAVINLLDSKLAVVGTGTTDSSGIATIAVPQSKVAATAGQLALTGQLVGTNIKLTQASVNSLTLSTSVENQSLSFLPATSTVAKINESATIAVQVQAATQAELLNNAVSFTTSEGTLGAASVAVSGITQNAAGLWVGSATTTLISGSPGNAALLVKFNGTSVQGTVQIISTFPADATLQAGVNVLAPKSHTAVIAQVRDANGAPVSNAVVNFTISADPSGGTLSSPQAITDSSGQASVTYTAGSTSTLADAVKISAVATGGSPATTAVTPVLTLTVAQQSAFITVAQNGAIVLKDEQPTFYFKDFADSVVDIAGNPITSQQVSVVLVPTTFSKGVFRFLKEDTVINGVKYLAGWNQIISVTCSASDFKNIPNPAALVTATSATAGASATYSTDASGAFSYQIRYGKNYANWVNLDMNASTVVGTNRSVSSLSLNPLPYAVTELDPTGQASPAWAISPYGTGSTCNDLK